MGRVAGWVIGLAAVVGLVIGGALVTQGAVPCDVLESQPACQVVLRPGPTDDAVSFVRIDGVDEDPPGELRLTTVAVDDQLTWRSWFTARSSSSSEAVPREVIYPPGVNREQVAETNAALMVDSQQTATVVALEQLGFELEGRGALVAAVTEDAVTDDLREGDLIVAVDDAEVSESADVVREVQQREPGTVVRLRVLPAPEPDDDASDVEATDDTEAEENDGPAGDDGQADRDRSDGMDEAADDDGQADGDAEAARGEPRDIAVTLGASPDDPDRAYIGVLLTTDLDLPVDVRIDAGVIGGPSAGLLFALAIVDLLGEDDLTGGAVVAGTGTLDRAGEVGAVGGVRQKVAGASAPTDGTDPATVFLVPRGNLAEARDVTVANDLLVVPVDTLDDALAALEDLRAGRDPDGAIQLAAGRW